MYSVAELRKLAYRYCAATGISPSSLSELACGNNRTFERMLWEGGSCRADTAERASKWFDQHWPDDVPWPLAARRETCPGHEAA